MWSSPLMNADPQIFCVTSAGHSRAWITSARRQHQHRVRRMLAVNRWSDSHLVANDSCPALDTLGTYR